ncbi:uncharacterized protein LOC131427083 isoform X2 [Malaya genurostris]|uniref:uncharacterized protein LOC131427083 isoform X2 n=1 Tax=Malaya genurostris TaxID=325434 RepID=UPI0026F3F4AC|nr:uncharacterized protein LOC131427083 isoform X2 [Malaya genurostris]
MSIKRESKPKIWKRDEILVFLDVFESTFHSSVSDPFDSEWDMWECISNKLLTKGCNASAQHCRNKWNFLYKTYTQTPNQTSAFYAKIKQIVDFSQNLNDQPGSEESPDVETACEIEIFDAMVDDNIVKLEMPSSNEQEVETLDDRLESSCSPEHESPTVVGQELELEETVDDVPIKRTKVAVEDYSNTIEQKVRTQIDCLNLKSILDSIVTKINAIQTEQLSQRQRLETLESLQRTSCEKLMNIEKHLCLS